VGTCLTLSDLHKVIRKTKTVFPIGVPEYSIHATFVHLASQRCPQSRQMQRLLERKYQLAVKQFADASSEDELSSRWDDAVAEGNVPGPYWALMTHQASSEELRARAYGEVHMLSHLSGAANRADIETLRRLEKKLITLERSHARSRADFARRLQARDAQIRSLREDNERVVALERRLEEANAALGALKKDARSEGLSTRCTSLEHRLEVADGRVKTLNERLAKQSEESARLRDENSRLEAEIDGHARELEAMEYDLRSILSADKQCACPEKQQAGNGLCGRAVLYVGGRSNLVQYYRALVTHYGGEFMHHDGGQQESRSRLAALLSQADVVCCPTDCVSHDASLRLKRDCKRHGKPYILIRSSGLSSFSREVHQLASSFVDRTVRRHVNDSITE
jgi:hypothetical protein